MKSGHPPGPRTPGSMPFDGGVKSQVGPWTVHHFVQLNSTNLEAARLPAWHALRADRQTAGRGRFQRVWLSDAGGLWISAVLPSGQDPGLTRLLPLAVGLAVSEALAGLGVPGLRLRWPNDVLVGNRKLAGLLVDQFVPGLAVAGVGVNVTNQPETRDPLLQGQVCRLADFLSPVPSLTMVTEALLGALHQVWRSAQTSPPESWVSRLNLLWAAPRPVQLEVDEQVLTGQFVGVDPAGRLILHSADGEIRIFEPHEVRLLRDL